MRGLFGRKQSSSTQRQALPEEVKDLKEEASVGCSLATLVHGESDTVGVAKGEPGRADRRRSARAGERYGFHSMALQVKDIRRSLRFYQDNLGMRVCKQIEGGEYSMYFLTFDTEGSGQYISEEEAPSCTRTFGQRTGLLQLIHVHGSEKDDGFQVNLAGPGFVHFSITVPDVEEARDRMAGNGVRVIEDGSNAQGFAAVADPDGYSVQLIAESEGQHDGLKDELTKIMSTSSFGRLSDSIDKSHVDDNDPERLINSSTLTQRERALQIARGGSPASQNVA